jgi:dGTPase
MFRNAMSWKALLDETRVRALLHGRSSHKVSGESRTEYERDRDRTVYSAPLRRLIRKTQVFPLDPNDLVRTRLVHSIEVSTVAEGLASQIVRDVIRRREKLSEEQFRAIPKIAETCGILHDMGNPPFGHAGELAIASWFDVTDLGRRIVSDLGRKSQAAADFLKFEGNAQTLRLATNTHLLAHEQGLNLTCATAAAMRKYLAPSHEANEDSSKHEMTKPGFFVSESRIFRNVSEQTGTLGRRHPITYMVEAADDIVYSVVDLEDGMKKGLLNWESVRKQLQSRCSKSSVLDEALHRTDEQMIEMQGAPQALIDADYPQAFRVNAISAMVRAVVRTFDIRYREIMEGTYHKELIYDSKCEAATFVEACKNLLRETVFREPDVLRLETRGREVIHGLMDLFWEGVKTYLKDRKTHTKTYGGKLYLLISQNYRHAFEKRIGAGENKIYCGAQLVTDYISGMTDGFASRLHKDLTNG